MSREKVREIKREADRVLFSDGGKQWPIFRPRDQLYEDFWLFFERYLFWDKNKLTALFWPLKSLRFVPCEPQKFGTLMSILLLICNFKTWLSQLLRDWEILRMRSLANSACPNITHAIRIRLFTMTRQKKFTTRAEMSGGIELMLSDVLSRLFSTFCRISLMENLASWEKDKLSCQWRHGSKIFIQL